MCLLWIRQRFCIRLGWYRFILEGQWDLCKKKLEINHYIPRSLRNKWPRELEFYLVLSREPQGILNDGGGVRLALKNS